MAAHKKINRTQELETMGVLSLFFLILSVFTQRQSFTYCAVAFLVTALFVPPLAKVITGLWLKFSGIIGTFNSKVILSLVFFVFLTPLAFLFRAFTKNPLMLKKEPSSATFFTVREHTYVKKDFETMW